MPASLDDIQMAQQALYENEALRENLDDDEAEALLKWGEGCITRLGDAEDFSAACKALRRSLGAVDKLVARADLDEETAYKAIERLAESAPLLGLSLSAEQVSAALPPDPADRPATLAALLALLGGDAPAADAPPTPPAEALDTPAERLNQVMGKLRGLLGGEET